MLQHLSGSIPDQAIFIPMPCLVNPILPDNPILP